MKLHRFFCDEKLTDKKSVVITHAPLVNQLKNVFRLVKGDKIILFDNSGFDYGVSIEGFEKESVSLLVDSVTPNKVFPIRETYLFASIVKKDNFEWITQKATELGVSHIIPIISERTEKKDLNKERIQKIIVEASEQSGRGTLPVLSEVMDLETALQKFGHVKSIAWHTQAEKFVSQDLSDTLGAYIGPEGGWSNSEIDLFKKHGVRIRSLGPQVLRSETAVISVITLSVF